MRYALFALSILLGTAAPVRADVSVTVSIPGASIGIHQPVYPDLVLVPGSPVYYAPQVQANYFFYDGLYWVFQDDNWYVSSWYNGPWDLVEPDDVPLFVLRVPVQYYLRPPVYFQTWIVTAPPRWHYHWGPRWTRYHHGWDHWDRHAIPAPAPLPVYQRHYHGDRYPRREYQRVIRHEHYHYQSRDRIVRRHDQPRAAPRPQTHHAQPRPHNRSDSQREQRQPREREDMRRSEPRQVLPQQRLAPAQEPRQTQRQETPRGRPDTPRPQRAQRAPETQRPQAMQVLPQQRAAVQEQRARPRPQAVPRAQPAPRAQAAPRPQQAPRAQQAPRPQQTQARPPARGFAQQPQANAGRQGPGPQRGGGGQMR